MTCTVSQIVSWFHDFPNHEKENNFVAFHSKKRKGKALLLATIDFNASSMKKNIGVKTENKMIDLYERITGRAVIHRNEKTYSIEINNMKIFGKVDGIVDKDGIIIEHKRRINGFLNRVPYHERVQCFFYMKMTGLNTSHLVESFGEQIKIHEINFDEEIWQDIEMRCFN
jgi:hypothetical protein